MTEWAFNIATNEYNCSKCGAKRKELCKMPSGRLAKIPHGERVQCLTKTDWNRCQGIASNVMEVLTKY